MPHTQTFTAIERPPFYHPPRSRPVAFESPDNHYHQQQTERIAHSNHQRSFSVRYKTHEAANFLRENLPKSYIGSGQNQKSEQKKQANHTDCNMVNPKDQLRADQLFNNSPRPFVKGSLYESSGPINQHQYSTQVYGDDCAATRNVCQKENLASHVVPPKIVVSDHHQAYPTSTVHKSMLNSSRMVPVRSNASCDGLNYSRLISPTVLSASYESLPRTSSSGVGDTRTASFYEDTSQQSLSSFQATDHSGLASGEVAQQRSASKFSDQATSASPISRSSGEAVTLTAEPQQKQQQQQQQRPGSALIGSASSSSAGNAEALIDFDYIHKQLPSSPGSGVALQMQCSPKSSSNSNSVVPDSKRDEYMWNRQLERVSIAHQTYRTLPIVVPKPKARHDLASGTYMGYSQDPTWELTRSRSSSLANRDHERKIRQAIRSEMATLQPSQVSGLPATTNFRSEDSVPVFNYRQYIEATRRAY